MMKTIDNSLLAAVTGGLGPLPGARVLVGPQAAAGWLAAHGLPPASGKARVLVGPEHAQRWLAEHGYPAARP